MAEELTQELVNELFEYRDGDLYWKVLRSNRYKLGDRAGTVTCSNRYETVGINSKRYLLHRIVFLMHHGYLPEMVDHIDGNPFNNRIENLRPASNSQNQYNRKLPKNNTSGVKGVSWHSRINRWRAVIVVNKKQIACGSFKEFDDAVEAVRLARLEHHGEFANHG